MKLHLCSAALTGAASNILVWVLAENVPDDHNSLLDHIVDLGLNQVQQGADAALSRLLKQKDSVSQREEKLIY